MSISLFDTWFNRSYNLNMFAPFKPDRALEMLSFFYADLLAGRVYLTEPKRISPERKNSPVMIGGMIAQDPLKNEFNLITVSGLSKTVKSRDPSFDRYIFVPPVVSPDLIDGCLDKNDFEIHELTDKITMLKNEERAEAGEDAENKISSLKEKRKKLCNESLKKVYDLYKFATAQNTEVSMLSCTKGKLPPTGTGECCAPKLLHYAFKNNLTPVSMAECVLPAEIFSVADIPCEAGAGASSATDTCSGAGAPVNIRIFSENTAAQTPFNLVNIQPCDERCALILPSMLGIEILYRDDFIIVVNKQSGLLSVPGRGPEKSDCIVNRVKRLFPNCMEQPAVHRLDMETSGLMVLAFTKEAQRNLNMQFESGTVEKNYIALIDGVLARKGIEMHGTKELYFRLDVENRPHQIWDSVYGKKAVTEWQVLDVEDYVSPDGKKRPVTRVKFIPHTGRTHQLRLCASDSHGFGLPIVGDTLYGHCEKGERLMLHAEYLSFTHPATGEKISFTSSPDF